MKAGVVNLPTEDKHNFDKLIKHSKQRIDNEMNTNDPYFTRSKSQPDIATRQALFENLSSLNEGVDGGPTRNRQNMPLSVVSGHGDIVGYNNVHDMREVIIEAGSGDEQFAGLLEAVTSAVGEEQQQRQDEEEEEEEAHSANNSGPGRMHLGKGARKRRRGSNGPHATSGDNRMGFVEEEDNSKFEIREFPPPLIQPDARAAGVHSSAALFRRPSSSSSGKKRTRPPMSKLFSSLELSPENFLHLQAAAKMYMLDENHPERLDCVGNRGRADRDMVKLRLYNCVKSFLEDEGHGQNYFGRQTGGRRLMWPEQKHEIITSVTFLLRRIVTNERQRQYAVESRKESSKKRKYAEVDGYSGIEDMVELQAWEVTEAMERIWKEKHTETVQDQSADRSEHRAKRSRLSQPKATSSQTHCNQPRAATKKKNKDLKVDDNTIKLEVSLVDEGNKRLAPRQYFHIKTCQSFPDLERDFQERFQLEGPTQIWGLLPRGLRVIDDEESLGALIGCVEETEWMDREAKILVEKGAGPDRVVW